MVGLDALTQHPGHLALSGASMQALRGKRPEEKVIQLSWKPSEIRTSKGMFITQKAKPKMERSTVADNDSGKSVLSEIRTSAGMFIDKRLLQGRAAVLCCAVLGWRGLGCLVVVPVLVFALSQGNSTPNPPNPTPAPPVPVPVPAPVVPSHEGEQNQEAMQVLQYKHGQKYEAHYDDYHDKQTPMQGGHRIATVLMYLSEIQKGGETVFPNAAPKKGDALLFWSLKPDATADFFSLHSGCPVIEGEKWSATKWIHVNSFEPPKRDPSVCTDDDPRCPEWAGAGECAKNPVYMVGDDRYPGSCRKACKVCVPKAEAEAEGRRREEQEEEEEEGEEEVEP
eukprot:jgi/Mesen1/2656/ME000167S01803